MAPKATPATKVAKPKSSKPKEKVKREKKPWTPERKLRQQVRKLGDKIQWRERKMAKRETKRKEKERLRHARRARRFRAIPRTEWTKGIVWGEVRKLKLRTRDPARMVGEVKSNDLLKGILGRKIDGLKSVQLRIQKARQIDDHSVTAIFENAAARRAFKATKKPLRFFGNIVHRTGKKGAVANSIVLHGNFTLIVARTILKYFKMECAIRLTLGANQISFQIAKKNARRITRGSKKICGVPVIFKGIRTGRPLSMFLKKRQARQAQSRAAWAKYLKKHPGKTQGDGPAKSRGLKRRKMIIGKKKYYKSKRQTKRQKVKASKRAKKAGGSPAAKAKASPAKAPAKSPAKAPVKAAPKK